jgi:hypothetical protein
MPVRIWLLATVAATAAYSQSVVSVRSGLINFSEGEVFLNGAPVEQKAGKFPELREGSELRTDAGRAEVLLTPGMIVRVGPDSSISMLSASLIDTRVEFRRGSAVIEVSQDPDGTKSRIVYRDYQILFPKRGSFRIDSMPREFRVLDGEAEVTYLTENCSLKKDQKVSLYGGLEAETLHRSISDGLDEWSMRRDTQLQADNPPPGDLNGDPNALDPGFSLAPFAGMPYYSTPVSTYGSAYNYLPGYIPPFNTYGSYGFIPYSPIYINLPSRPVIYSPPIRTPVRYPVYSGPRPVTIRPIGPVSRPTTILHK